MSLASILDFTVPYSPMALLGDMLWQAKPQGRDGGTVYGNIENLGQVGGISQKKMTYFSPIWLFDSIQDGCLGGISETSMKFAVRFPCDLACLNTLIGIWLPKYKAEINDAWCLMAPSHYMCLCWLIVKGILWHSPKINFTRNAQELNP